MSDEDEQVSMAARLEQAVMHQERSFAQLWPIANEAIGRDRSDHGAPGYRFTDRWLQRQRKLGFVDFVRKDGRAMWTMTTVGRRVYGSTT